MSLEPIHPGRLAEHEAAIERSLAELGWHLRTIRDERLYLERYETFEAYCRERWSLSRAYVYRQIAAAHAIDVIESNRASNTLSPMGDTPTERQVRPIASLPDDEIAEIWTEAVEEYGESPTAVEVVDIRDRRRTRTPQAVPKRSVAPGVPPHPATFSIEVLGAITAMLQEVNHGAMATRPMTIVDPFAGVGTIHKLADLDWGVTIGVEIEAEWAAAHPDTIHGDSRHLVELIGDSQADVIVTSPAYGNRLADSYKAYDPEARRSYAIDLGHELTEGNGGGMPFTGDPKSAYCTLHAEVWAACARVLRPDGMFILNCKDFVRDGIVMSVTAWHIHALREHGFEVVDLMSLPVAGLAMTTAAKFSELIVVLERPT